VSVFDLYGAIGRQLVLLVCFFGVFGLIEVPDWWVLVGGQFGRGVLLFFEGLLVLGWYVPAEL